MLLCRLQQSINLVFAQRLGQALRPSRPLDANRGIVGAQAFVKGEAVELPHGGKSARAGGAGQTLFIAMHQIGFDIALRRGVKIKFLIPKPVRKVAQIALIGQECVMGGAQFGGLRLEKECDPVLALAHPRAPSNSS